jgi:hypothetical protein
MLLRYSVTFECYEELPNMTLGDTPDTIVVINPQITPFRTKRDRLIYLT